MDVSWPASGRQKVYDLAQPLEHGIPHHPAHPPYAFTLTKQHGEIMYSNGVSAASELFTFGGHVGTHIDALGHVSKDGRIHGDLDIREAQSYTGGIGHASIARVPPFFASGFLVNAPAVLGRPLTTKDAVGGDLFEEWFTGRRAPTPGSVVLVRTGWDEHWADNRTYVGVGEGTPGVDLSGAQWLSERRIAATGADTLAYETFPSDLGVHVHLLVDSGIYIMEAMHLAELAADGVEEFFFVAVPLAIQGGTGSPIRPLAIVPQGS